MDQTRRDVLRHMGMGLFGLTLGHRFFMRDALGVEPQNPFFDACIQIFYDGGPSQTDTWDPKPGSKNNVVGTLTLGANDIYGRPIQVADHFGGIANLVNGDPASFGLALFRSIAHGSGDHGASQEYMNCFWGSRVAPRKPSTAACMGHLFKDRTGDLGVPSVVIEGSNGNASNDAKGANMPAALSVSSRAREVVDELSLNVDRDRYDRRQRITAKINERFLGTRPDEMVKAWNKAWQDAYNVTTKGLAAKAFDLTGKPLLVGGGSSSKELATKLTLAQELLKAGVPYVSLGVGGNDTHSDNRARVQKVWRDDTDPLVAELARNLKATGKRVLILMGGEFGRTPETVANGRDGRDHWGRGFSWAAIGVNQPKFKTTAIGDTGPDGVFTTKDATLVDPISPGGMGAFVYRALGFQVGTDAAFNVPLDVGQGSAVDPSAAFNEGPKLMQSVGLV